jgi:hypothetical protein
MEEDVVIPVTGQKKRRRVSNLAYRAPPEEAQKDAGISWIQEGVTPCNSGMAKRELHETNLDRGNLWTT